MCEVAPEVCRDVEPARDSIVCASAVAGGKRLKCGSWAFKRHFFKFDEVRTFDKATLEVK